MKVINQLLSGRMGMDVCYAMQPSYKLAVDEDQIPIELVGDFLRSASLHKWAWDCIKEERVERFPPANLLVANIPSKY